MRWFPLVALCTTGCFEYEVSSIVDTVPPADGPDMAEGDDADGETPNTGGSTGDNALSSNGFTGTRPYDPSITGTGATEGSFVGTRPHESILEALLGSLKPGDEDDDGIGTDDGDVGAPGDGSAVPNIGGMATPDLGGLSSGSGSTMHHPTYDDDWYGSDEVDVGDGSADDDGGLPTPNSGTSPEDTDDLHWATDDLEADDLDWWNDPWSEPPFGVPEEPYGEFSTARMTGGGFFGGSAGKYYHAFTIHCDFTHDSEMLNFNLGNSGHFRVEGVYWVVCLDDPALNAMQPEPTFDTLVGVGWGNVRGLDGEVWFVLTDDGEPGTNDHTEFEIVAGTRTWTGGGFLTRGNHQVHDPVGQQ